MKLVSDKKISLGLVLAIALFSSVNSSIAQGHRATQAYDSAGGVRQGQEATQTGFDILGFHIKPWWEANAKEPITKTDPFPGYADPGKKEIVPPTVIDHRPTPQPIQQIPLPKDPTTSGPVVKMPVEFYSPGYGTFTQPCDVRKIADPQGLGRDMYKNVNNGQVYQMVNTPNGVVLRPI